jgi:hypothetical protein
MNDYVYLVTVTDQIIWFDKVEKPSDWEEKAIEQPYGELNGVYLGWKQFEANSWYLRRDKKMPKNSGMSWYQWRMTQPSNSFGDYPYSNAYAWEPCYYHKYNNRLYSVGASFH